jgi:hypothetical protein
MLTYPFSEERFIHIWLSKMNPLHALRKPKKKKKSSLLEEVRRIAVRRSHLLLAPVMFVYTTCSTEMLEK